VVFVHISRILSGRSPDDHLPRASITERLLRLSSRAQNPEGILSPGGTVLHAGKDLAVSPHVSPHRLVSLNFRSARRFLSFVGSVSARTSYIAVRRALPATILHSKLWACPDFPPRTNTRRSSCLTIIPQYINLSKIFNCVPALPILSIRGDSVLHQQ
jgi:hypothetical protein